MQNHNKQQSMLICSPPWLPDCWMHIIIVKLSIKHNCNNPRAAHNCPLTTLLAANQYVMLNQGREQIS